MRDLLRTSLVCCLFSHQARELASAMPLTQETKARLGWEHFPHDADVGVRGFGPTVEGAFEQAALALTATVTDAEIAAAVPIEVSCDAPDLELLFVEWLNAIIYEMAVRKMLFSKFSVRIAGLHLDGTLWGEAVDPDRHAPACEPKGATYTVLRVGEEPNGGWAAGCVVDV